MDLCADQCIQTKPDQHTSGRCYSAARDGCRPVKRSTRRLVPVLTSNLSGVNLERLNSSILIVTRPFIVKVFHVLQKIITAECVTRKPHYLLLLCAKFESIFCFSLRTKPCRDTALRRETKTTKKRRSHTAESCVVGNRPPHHHVIEPPSETLWKYQCGFLTSRLFDVSWRELT